MFSASDLFSLIVSDENHSCEMLVPLAETPDTTLKTIVQPVYKIDCFPRKLELSTPKLFSAMCPALESHMHHLESVQAGQHYQREAHECYCARGKI